MAKKRVYPVRIYQKIGFEDSDQDREFEYSRNFSAVDKESLEHRLKKLRKTLLQDLQDIYQDSVRREVSFFLDGVELLVTNPTEKAEKKAELHRKLRNRDREISSGHFDALL